MSALADPDDPVIACLDCRGCRCSGRPGGCDCCRTGETWRQCADVLYAGRPRPCRAAASLASRALRRYPGCELVVVRRAEGGWIPHARRSYRPPVRCPAAAALTHREVMRLLCAWYAELVTPGPGLRPGPAAAPGSAARRER